MRVLIDLQGVQTESRFRGIGRYSLSLSKEIVRRARSHEINIVLNQNLGQIDAIEKEFQNLIPKTQLLTFSTPVLGPREQKSAWHIRTAELIREAFLSAFQPDFVYTTSLMEGMSTTASIGLLHSGYRDAVTLYDLIPLRQPEDYLTHQPFRDFYLHRLEYLKKADVLFAISEYSRQEGIDNLHIPSEKVVTILGAADEMFTPVQLSLEQSTAIKVRYGIEKPFVMYSGGYDPRKNLIGLIKAFSLIPPDLKNKYQLLIAGKASMDAQGEILFLAKRLGIQKSLLFTGYIPDEDLVALYSLCDLFILPSLHEGFGLPALEAMSCGAPVIASNATSIPEVVGCQDALFDPTKPEAIAEKIVYALSNPEFRDFLREHGLQQAKKFSWKTCAQSVLDTLETFKPQPVLAKSFSLVTGTNEYYALIHTISSVPRHDVKITNGDLMNTAEAIRKNQIEINRVLLNKVNSG